MLYPGLPDRPEILRRGSIWFDPGRVIVISLSLDWMAYHVMYLSVIRENLR